MKNHNSFEEKVSKTYLFRINAKVECLKSFLSSLKTFKYSLSCFLEGSDNSFEITFFKSRIIDVILIHFLIILLADEL